MMRASDLQFDSKLSDYVNRSVLPYDIHGSVRIPRDGRHEVFDVSEAEDAKWSGGETTNTRMMTKLCCSMRMGVVQHTEERIDRKKQPVRRSISGGPALQSAVPKPTNRGPDKVSPVVPTRKARRERNVTFDVSTEGAPDKEMLPTPIVSKEKESPGGSGGMDRIRPSVKKDEVASDSSESAHSKEAPKGRGRGRLNRTPTIHGAIHPFGKKDEVASDSSTSSV